MTPPQVPPTKIVIPGRAVAKAVGRPAVSKVPVARGGVGAPVQQYGNTALTIALLVMAAVLVARWRNRSAEAARAAVDEQLEQARGLVEQLQPRALAQLPPAELATRVRSVRATAGEALADVVNKAEDPVTRARALVARGDLYWAVANVPPLPGASTQPALRPDPPADQALAQAADAYTTAVAAGGTKADTAAAHLGLAAVAENRRDWPAARQHLGAVADDPDPAVAVLALAARSALAEVPALQAQVYVAAPSAGDTTAGPMTAGVPTPAALGPVRPTTLPVSAPATRPAMMPAAPPTFAEPAKPATPAIGSPAAALPATTPPATPAAATPHPALTAPVIASPVAVPAVPTPVSASTRPAP